MTAIGSLGGLGGFSGGAMGGVASQHEGGYPTDPRWLANSIGANNFGARVLSFTNGNFRTNHGDVSLTVEKDGFQLGCTFVTWEAWRELKKRLEPATAVSSATTPEPTSQSAICRHNVNVGAGEVCHLCS